MPDDALLAETNRLIGRVLQLHEEQRAEGERMMAGHDERMAELRAKADAAMAESLKEHGATDEEAVGSSEEWEARRTAATRRTEENLETLRQRNEAHREELLVEMRTQTDLLRRIAERLEA